MATYTGSDKRLQFLFDMVSNFAQDYDNTRTYAVGAYTVYQGILYKCIVAVTHPEDFDDTKWTQVLVMNEISSGGGGSVVSITPTLSSGTKIADFSINGVLDELYAPSGGGGSGHDYSTSEQIIGKWIDNKPLYEKTYAFKIADLVAGTINSSLMDGQLHLDHISYDMIRIANGDIIMGSGTSGTIVSNPVNYPSGSTYIRANVQKQSGVNGGYPFIYLNMSYAVGSQFYTNRNLITFDITMQYTKTTD